MKVTRVFYVKYPVNRVFGGLAANLAPSEYWSGKILRVARCLREPIIIAYELRETFLPVQNTVVIVVPLQSKPE